MSIRLIQLRSNDGVRIVAAAEDSGDAWRIDGVASTYELARAAMESGSTLETQAQRHASAERIDLEQALSEQRILAPIDHPDSAHLHLTGTGLTHARPAVRSLGHPRPIPIPAAAAVQRPAGASPAGR